MSNDDNKQFRDYLKNIIDESGYSLRKLGRKTNLDHSYISRVLSGEFKTPSPDKLKTLSEHLPCSYTELMIKAGYLSEDILNDVVDEKDILRVPILKSNVLNENKFKEVFTENNNIKNEYIDDYRLYINTTDKDYKYFYMKVIRDSFSSDISAGDLILVRIETKISKGDLVVAFSDDKIIIGNIIYETEDKYLLQAGVREETVEVTDNNIIGKVIRIELE